MVQMGDARRSTAAAWTGTRSSGTRSGARRGRRRRLGRAISTTLRKSGNSVGAVIEVVAEGVPAGLGAPIYGKLDSDLAGAMMSINAVKGVEIGDGMAAAALTGVENADEIRMGNDGPEFLSNHAGGILGGISTGQPVVVASRSSRPPRS